MQTPEQRWNFQQWMMNCEVEKKRVEKRNDLGRLLNRTVYSLDDYGIRERGDHFESYNKITKESLFQAATREEAMTDLREEFA